MKLLGVDVGDNPGIVHPHAYGDWMKGLEAWARKPNGGYLTPPILVDARVCKHDSCNHVEIRLERPR